MSHSAGHRLVHRIDSRMLSAKRVLGPGPLGKLSLISTAGAGARLALSWTRG